MTDIALHPITKLQTEGFLRKPAHALLLEGRIGAGKTHLGEYIIAQLLGIPANKVVEYPHVLRVLPEKTSISIEQVRAIPQFVKLKMPIGKKPITRAILIENAETMAIEAQNALLKTLEEMPTDIVAVLTSVNTGHLLSTLRSRAALISVKPVSQLQAAKHFSPPYLTSDVERAYNISGGQMGLMSALLNNGDHELIEYIDYSKKLLTSNQLERLLSVDEFIKSKKSISTLLEALYIIARAGLKSSLAKNDYKSSKRWLSIKSHVLMLSSTSGTNPSQKLTLTNLMYNL